MDIGKVYHQQFEDGDRIYCRPVAKYKNGCFKALCMVYNRKPVLKSVDPSSPWMETPVGAIPKKMQV